MNHDNHEQFGEDLVKDIGQKGSSAAKTGGKAIGKAAVRKATGGAARHMLGFAVKKAGVALAQGLAMSMKAILPALLVAVLVVMLVVSAWYVIFEVRGKQQDYSHNDAYQNEMEVGEDNEYTVTEVSGQNTAIIDFYRNQQRTAYWQIIDEEDDPEWNYINPVAPYALTDNVAWVNPTGDVPYGLSKPNGTVEDYYKQEQTYTINANLLFALDEDLHKLAFRYPEQFTKPVYFEEANAQVKSARKRAIKPNRGVHSDYDRYVAAGDNGISVRRGDLTEGTELVAESRKFDSETGEYIDGTEKSVHDWGLASIFEYRKDKILRTVEGSYTKEDYYDENCKCIKQRSIDVPFKFIMTGYPVDIWLIEHVTTFRSDIELAYEQEKDPVGVLRNATSNNPASDANRIFWKKFDVYETRTREVQDPAYPDDPTKTIEEEYEVYVKTVDLYQYREGEILEEKPVPRPDKNKVEDYENDFLYDYTFHYETMAPLSVMSEFDFEERMGGTTIDLGNIKAGDKVGDENFNRTLQYLSIIQTHAANFGVDPYLIVALISQESGGRTDIKDGLMQIVDLGNDPRVVTAKNTSGVQESFSISGNERKDPEKAIKWGVMYFASKMQAHDKNPLKALQSYNFDVSGFMSKTYPEAWMDPANGWMQYREEARISLARAAGYTESKSASYWCAPHLEKSGGTRWGDICYIENVLGYYAGDQLGDIGKPSTEEPVDDEDKDEGGLFDSIVKIIAAIVAKTYDEDEKLFRYTNSLDMGSTKDILKQASTFDKKILFSETGDVEGTAFWDEGFNPNSTLPVLGGSYESFISMVPGASGYITPLADPNPIVSSCFGYRVHPIHGDRRLHRGVDVAVPTGTPQYAIADGVVEVSRDMGSGWGQYVIIRFKDGNSAVYAHLSQRLVQVGQSVTQGQAIGLTGTTGGSTGPHMHFEFETGGQYIDPYFIVIGATEGAASCK